MDNIKIVANPVKRQIRFLILILSSMSIVTIQIKFIYQQIQIFNILIKHNKSLQITTLWIFQHC